MDALPELRRISMGQGTWSDGQKIGRVHSGIRLQAPYANAIFKGTKTVEGRLASGWTLAARPGDCAVFEVRYPEMKVICRVQQVNRHPSFEAMLTAAGLTNCLPDCRSMAEGVRLYHSFPGFAERERNGVVAVTITCIGKLERGGSHGVFAPAPTKPLPKPTYKPITMQAPTPEFFDTTGLAGSDPPAPKRPRVEDPVQVPVTEPIAPTATVPTSVAPAVPPIGAQVRVISQSGAERQCKVVNSDEARIRVHYVGFEARFDEWIPVNSPRFLGEVQSESAPTPPASSRPVTQVSAPLQVGSKVVVVSKTGQRRNCTVVASGASQVKIHYDTFDNKFDEWIQRDSQRLLNAN